VFPSGVHSVKLRHDRLFKVGVASYRRAPQPQATGIRIARNWRTLRHADCIKQCPSSSAKRKTYARTDRASAVRSSHFSGEAVINATDDQSQTSTRRYTQP
jgi:hypothetical protein